MNLRYTFTTILLGVLLISSKSPRTAQANFIDNPLPTLLEDLFGQPTGNLINIDYNSSLNRGWTYAQAFTPTETLGFGDALSLQFWGGTAFTPTPTNLDFQFRILFDRPDGQAPSSDDSNSYSGSLHSFRQVRDLTASGTHTLTSAPPGVNTVWSEYNSFINIQQTLTAGTQYWIEILEFNSETVEDVNEFFLLPSSVQGANADQRRAAFTPVTWFSSNTAAFRLTEVPEPSTSLCLLLGLSAMFSKRLRRQTVVHLGSSKIDEGEATHE